ncbi:MAG: hypothetical protein NTZ50_11250 [Chloroflexi bacterium]|nr:hypothetical protein [Chloroflexota bacterium]
MSIYSLRKFAGVWFAPFLGGVIFLVVFHIAYLGIKPGDYVNRDDGVITLSHARNLVDFGFIGVNPSGERVEGYSAPVQMFVFALVYGVGRIGWPTFTAAQTTFSTFVLGVLFVIPFRRRRLFASAAAAVAAVLLTQLTSFLEWHASGMENAITHVLFAACVVVLCWFAQRRTIDRLGARTASMSRERCIASFLNCAWHSACSR